MGLFESFNDELEKIAISKDVIVNALRARRARIADLRSAARSAEIDGGATGEIAQMLRDRANKLEYRGVRQQKAISKELSRRGTDRAATGTAAGAADAATAQAAIGDVKGTIRLDKNNPFADVYDRRGRNLFYPKDFRPRLEKGTGGTWKGPALSVPKREKYLRGPVDPRVVNRAQRAGQPLNRGVMRMPKATPIVSSPVKSPFRKKMYQPDPFKVSK